MHVFGLEKKAGRSKWNPHRKRENMSFSERKTSQLIDLISRLCCEVTVLTTAPLCHTGNFLDKLFIHNSYRETIWHNNWAIKLNKVVAKRFQVGESMVHHRCEA